jgi:hypothetical protein
MDIYCDVQPLADLGNKIILLRNNFKNYFTKKTVPELFLRAG